MSEVKKILDNTQARAKGHGFSHALKSETEQAIYDLLIEKAIDYDLVTHDFGTPQIVAQAKAIPVSAINELFGRTE